MSSIAVIHRRFGVGGSTSVCFHILEALQDEYDVHLYSLHRPDFSTLNNAFGTEVHDITVHTPDIVTGGLDFSDSILRTATRSRIGVESGLELTLLVRRYGHQWDTFDLRIGTQGELPLSSPAIQYLHHPFLNRWSDAGHFEIESTFGSFLNRVYTRVSGTTPDTVQQSELLTNSQWTANQIEKIYAVTPDVVFPPIDVDAFDDVPWHERENGFVSVGRISQDKQTHRAIEIIDNVRERGHRVHLHLVGPIDEDTRYGRRIRREETNHPWLIVEGRVSQEHLTTLIERHRWGIHTKPFEHFGMAVAEQVAGGVIPFVPDSGGQVEIVGRIPTLCYDSIDEAIENISNCLSTSSEPTGINRCLPDIKNRFSKTRFKSKIISYVGSII